MHPQCGLLLHNCPLLYWGLSAWGQKNPRSLSPLCPSTTEGECHLQARWTHGVSSLGWIDLHSGDICLECYLNPVTSVHLLSKWVTLEHTSWGQHSTQKKHWYPRVFSVPKWWLSVHFWSKVARTVCQVSWEILSFLWLHSWLSLGLQKVFKMTKRLRPGQQASAPRVPSGWLGSPGS